MRKTLFFVLALLSLSDVSFAGSSRVARAPSLSSALSSFATDLLGTTFADDQVFVADNSSGGTPRTLGDCDDSGGNHLNYDTATNSFSCGTTSSGAGGWTDAGTEINNTTSTDKVGIGGAALGMLSVRGTSDQNQFTVRSYSTQTSLPFIVENNSGTDLVTIDNSGNMVVLGTLTVGGSATTTTFGDASSATYTLASNLSGSTDPTIVYADAAVKFSANIDPSSSDGAALGTTALMWSDLFLASGGVINFNNGNYTLTHTAGVLTANGAFSIGTSNALTAGTIELGAASDTTLSRSAAGVLAVESVVVPSISSTNTLTNKRVTKRSGTTTSSATPTINTDNTDFYSLSAQAAAITSFTTNLSGTPVVGDTLWIAITDNGTARAITWGTSFEASGTVALPTTTVISTRLDVGFVWNDATSKWRCVATS